MRARSGWAWRLLLALSIGIALLGALATGVRISNRSRLDDQLKEIARRGEPVELPEGVATPGGQATLAWVKQFQDCTGENDEWLLSNGESLQALLALPESCGVAGEDRARVQRLCACLAQNEELADHARALLHDGVPAEQWDECSRDWILSRGLCCRPVQGFFAQPLPEDPLDPEPARGMERLCPQLRNTVMAARALLFPMGDFAARGESVEIVRRVRLAGGMEAVLSRQPGLVMLLARLLIANTALDSCAIALAQFPPTTALDELGTLFDSYPDERAEFRRTLLEERAIGDEVYAMLKLPPSSWLGYDQPYFLEVHEQLLGSLERGSTREISQGIAEVQDGIQRRAESWRRYASVVALLMLGRYIEPWNELLARRARVELVRAGLRARKLAPEAALEEARRGRDPFVDGLLHARLDPDGLLTIWSVGPNGADDGGPSALERERRGVDGLLCDDIAVRVRLR